MGHRRRGLVLVLAALAGLGRPPASASANPVLVHITRTVTGESALLQPRPRRPRSRPPSEPKPSAPHAGHHDGPKHLTSPRAPSLPRRARSGVSRTSTITIVHGYADPNEPRSSTSHTQGRALDLRIDNVDCADIERFLVERPRLLARVGCFPNATFFHVDVGSKPRHLV